MPGAIGVLELTLPHTGDEDDASVLEQIRQAAHATAPSAPPGRRAVLVEHG